MERIFISLLVLLFSAISCLGQSVSANELNGTKWKHDIGDFYSRSYEETVEFSPTEMTTVINQFTKNKVLTFKSIYYTSNIIPTDFSTELVGKNLPKGKYLVELDETWKIMRVHKIEKFTTDSLILNIVNLDEHTYGVASLNKYVRIK